MGSKQRLYLVSSRPGSAARATHCDRAHLRLVPRVEVPVSVSAPPPSLRPAAARGLSRAPVPPRAPSRPLARRVLRLASDCALFAVALLIGLRPSA